MESAPQTTERKRRFKSPGACTTGPVAKGQRMHDLKSVPTELPVSAGLHGPHPPADARPKAVSETGNGICGTSDL